MKRDFVKDALLGVAVGDAIGVPAEFKSRGYLRERPITGMQGYGTHFQPEGTWSDDSSLTFCLAEMLAEKYDLVDLARRFVRWNYEAYWTPHDKVFDIGMATAAAIDRLSDGVTPELSGGIHEDSNGNGSLMRILPLLFLVREKEMRSRFQMIKEVSSLTHRHIRSVVACFIYLEVAKQVMEGNDKIDAYQRACVGSTAFLDESGVCPTYERGYFERILSGTIFTLPEEKIWSSGYVIHTLEASLWCFLGTDSYRDAVLRAVNLGEDTDTTAAVTGGLAALYYGGQTIPAEWLEVLARRADIEDLSRRLRIKLEENG